MFDIVIYILALIGGIVTFFIGSLILANSPYIRIATGYANKKWGWFPHPDSRQFVYKILNAEDVTEKYETQLYELMVTHFTKNGVTMESDDADIYSVQKSPNELSSKEVRKTIERILDVYGLNYTFIGEEIYEKGVKVKG